MTSQIEVQIEEEDRKETMLFIESKRNWDVENQRLRKPEAEKCTANIEDCKIYWRGECLILEHDDIIHNWDFFPYCFLMQAFELIQPEKPKKWKTVDRLMEFRDAIRQTEVNGCNYVDDLLEGEKMTFHLFKKFMRLARAQDYQHHGSHTF